MISRDDDKYIIQKKPEVDALCQVLLDKGLVAGLQELQTIDLDTLTHYLAGPLGKEAFDVQQVVVAFKGLGHDFVRGLCIGLVTGFLTSPDSAHRDIRGCLAILANDGIDVISGEMKEGYDLL